MLVTESLRSHITQAYCSLATAIYKRAALGGVELRRRDNLSQLLHIGRLDVHDVWGNQVKVHQPIQILDLLTQTLKTRNTYYKTSVEI